MKSTGNSSEIDMDGGRVGEDNVLVEEENTTQIAETMNSGRNPNIDKTNLTDESGCSTG